jgi:hypothetical protein
MTREFSRVIQHSVIVNICPYFLRSLVCDGRRS